MGPPLATAADDAARGAVSTHLPRHRQRPEPLPQPAPLGIRLEDRHVAREPIEARGLRRDDGRLLVSPGDGEPAHARFRDLPTFLGEGDLLVVNTSATVPAALDGRLRGEPVVVHVSTSLPGELWLIELRTPIPGGSSEPLVVDPDEAGALVDLAGDGRARLLAPYAGSQRLWVADLDLEAPVVEHLCRHGRPIRYRYVPQDWPIDAYQSVFGREPGSAEMPSAARPFTPDVVVDLVRRGVTIAPILLHTGVSSLEGHERPYPERYRVGAPTAALVNATHAGGGRVVAVGTTVVRALETVTDEQGTTHPGNGWTELVVTPEHRPRAVDGLLTGWHEPEASHLLMLEAVGGRAAIRVAYRAAHDAGYLWHEFGDSHLILPERSAR
jgi:S-adenosylmethionine:tRNA ribosyltransferase-isomerase